ncbi:MAG: ACP phosphodiesterase [Fulvivirga sp.]|uniref:acyl carrier protein phosphodiesterase n=1 Tax=Fulvivirga sp. TaxID=1931237 RepID=UPI0032EC81B3
MNFLAHIYLSGDNQKLMVGNFMGDFVKGSSFDHYDEIIVKGIWLHRAIDEYTDNHKIVAKSKDRLRAKYRHYSGVIVDVFYDHFLAKNWPNYHPEKLLSFTEKAYAILASYKNIMPSKAQYVLPYMMEGNWLYHYAKTEGIHKSLSGMARRTKYNSKMEEAVNDLNEHYEDFEKEFTLFFSDLKDFCSNWIAKELT